MVDQPESIFTALSREMRLAQLQGKRLGCWRLSPAGYDRVRADAEKHWMAATTTIERSLLGLPYSVFPGQDEPFILVCGVSNGLRADEPFTPNWDEPGEYFTETRPKP